MPRRLAAALIALLTFAPVLAVVPLAASPAGAHTQTVKRCAFDPFAGQQCWREAVAHTHPPPSVHQQIVGPTGPDTEVEPGPDPEAKAKAEAEAKAKAEAEAKAKAEAERKRKANEEAERQRKKAEEKAAAMQKAAEEEAARQAAEKEAAKKKAAEEAARQAAEKEAAKKKAEGDGSGGRGGAKNCATGQHRHHGYGCHAAKPWDHSHNGLGVSADSAGAKAYRAACPHGYRLHVERNKCRLPDSVRIAQNIGKVVLDVEGEVICTFTGGAAATKVVNAVLKGASEAAKYITKTAVERTIEHPCDQVWDDLTEWALSKQYKPDTAEPDSGDDEEGTGCHPAKGMTCGDSTPKDSTQKDSTPKDTSEADSTPVPHFPATLDGVREARKAREAGKIDNTQYHGVLHRFYCAQGYKPAGECE